MFGLGRRELVANFLHRTGALRLLEKVPFTDSPLVLIYHRIVRPEDCPYDRGGISATPDPYYEQALPSGTHQSFHAGTGRALRERGGVDSRMSFAMIRLNTLQAATMGWSW